MLGKPDLTVKHVLHGHSKRRPLKFKTEYRLMQVKSIAECSNSAILSSFIKLPFVIKINLFCLFWSGRLRQILLYISFPKLIIIV